MKLEIVRKGAPKRTDRDYCPWMISMPPESGR